MRASRRKVKREREEEEVTGGRGEEEGKSESGDAWEDFFRFQIRDVRFCPVPAYAPRYLTVSPSCLLPTPRVGRCPRIRGNRRGILVSCDILADVCCDSRDFDSSERFMPGSFRPDCVLSATLRRLRPALLTRFASSTMVIPSRWFIL